MQGMRQKTAERREQKNQIGEHGASCERVDGRRDGRLMSRERCLDCKRWILGSEGNAERLPLETAVNSLFEDVFCTVEDDDPGERGAVAAVEQGGCAHEA